jgi:hypothetical protein
MNAYGVATEEELQNNKRRGVTVSLGNQKLSGHAGDAFLAEVANTKKEPARVIVTKCLVSIGLYIVFGELLSLSSRCMCDLRCMSHWF